MVEHRSYSVAFKLVLGWRNKCYVLERYFTWDVCKWNTEYGSNWVPILNMARISPPLRFCPCSLISINFSAEFKSVWKLTATFRALTSLWTWSLKATFLCSFKNDIKFDGVKAHIESLVWLLLEEQTILGLWCKHWCVLVLSKTPKCLPPLQLCLRKLTQTYEVHLTRGAMKWW